MLLYMDRKREHFNRYVQSDIANYEKEMHIAKYNRRGDGHAVSPPLRTTGRDVNRYCFEGNA